jgi:hypothetical protein
MKAYRKPTISVDTSKFDEAIKNLINSTNRELLRQARPRIHWITSMIIGMVFILIVEAAIYLFR